MSERHYCQRRSRRACCTSTQKVCPLTDAKRLPETRCRSLTDCFVGESPRPGHDSNLSWQVDVTRHDPDLALARRDDTGAVGPDEPGCALAGQRVLDTNHVLLRDAFGDAHDERDLRFHRLHDARGGERGWDVNHRRVDMDGILGLRTDEGPGDPAESARQRLSGGHAMHWRPPLRRPGAGCWSVPPAPC